MAHIFISYARGDVDFAQKLNADLQRLGVETWIDELGIRSGADWPDRIATAIENCIAILVILSPDSMGSKWVRRELEFADARDKKMLPLLFKQTKLPKTYELRFGVVQRADFTQGDYQANLADLLVAMEKELGLQFATSVKKVILPEGLKRVQDNRVIWEKDGKEMVRVPAGNFFYGNIKEVKYQPEFWIDKTPVTNAEFARFIATTGHESPIHWAGETPPGKISDHPVVNVSWRDAVAYADWAGKQMPIEEEWEKAARGTDGRIYPWGNQTPTEELANFGGKIGHTTPVGRYSPQGDSPYGCVDMAGNVQEWTVQGRRQTFLSIAIRLALRGGAFNGKQKFLRVPTRHTTSSGHTLDYVGFRTVFSSSSSDNDWLGETGKVPEIR